MFFLGSPIVPFDSFKPSPSDTRFSCCPKPSHRRLAQVVLEPLGRWSPGCPCLTARIEPWQMTICCGEFRPRIRKCGYIYISLKHIVPKLDHNSVDFASYSMGSNQLNSKGICIWLVVQDVFTGANQSTTSMCPLGFMIPSKCGKYKTKLA